MNEQVFNKTTTVTIYPKQPDIKLVSGINATVTIQPSPSIQTAAKAYWTALGFNVTAF